MASDTPIRMRAQHPLLLALAITVSLQSFATAARSGSIGEGFMHAGPAPRWRDATPSDALVENAKSGRAHVITSDPVFVSSCEDSGTGTLRAAFEAAVDGSVIDLSQLNCSAITLTTGALTDAFSAASVTVQAPYRFDAGGARIPTVAIEAHNTRVFFHAGSGTLGLIGLQIRNGVSYGVDAKGGCVYSAGSLAVSASSFESCYANATASSTGLGGAIYAASLVTLSDVSITDSATTSDTGYAYGGGIFTRGGLQMVYSNIQYCEALGTPSGIGYGGAMAVQGGMQMSHSLIAHNIANYDGGIALFSGDSLILDSTIAKNTAFDAVGGVESNAELAVAGSTIADNAGYGPSPRAGGLFADYNHVLTLTSTIVASNTQNDNPSDIGGIQMVGGSNNLIVHHDVTVPMDTISDDPLLGPLADNGGRTPTLALLPGSAAIDRGVSDQTFDQRGIVRSEAYGQILRRFERSVGRQPDIGAFEYGAGDVVFADGFERVNTALAAR